MEDKLSFLINELSKRDVESKMITERIAMIETKVESMYEKQEESTREYKELRKMVCVLKNSSASTFNAEFRNHDNSDDKVTRNEGVKTLKEGEDNTNFELNEISTIQVEGNSIPDHLILVKACAFTFQPLLATHRIIFAPFGSTVFLSYLNYCCSISIYKYTKCEGLPNIVPAISRECK